MKRIVPAASLNRRTVISTLPALAVAAGSLVSVTAAAQALPGLLPSWNDGPAKQAILDFVRATTDRRSSSFVQPEDRIATFDQDGTLWVEHPLYTQAMFALDRVRMLAPQHPEWQSQEPFKAVLSDDLPTVAHFTERDWAEIIFLTHSGHEPDGLPGDRPAVVGNSEASAV